MFGQTGACHVRLLAPCYYKPKLPSARLVFLRILRQLERRKYQITTTPLYFCENYNCLHGHYFHPNDSPYVQFKLPVNRLARKRRPREPLRCYPRLESLPAAKNAFRCPRALHTTKLYIGSLFMRGIEWSIRDFARPRDPCLKIRDRDSNFYIESEPETLPVKNLSPLVSKSL